MIVQVLIAFLFLLLGLYVFALFAVAWYTLHPLRIPILFSAGALGLPQESVQFKSDDGVTLRGWWISPPNPQSVAVLCHGYMMNRTEAIPLAQRLYRENVAVLVFDFRRHGTSGGKRTTIGWEERRDVRAAADFARNKLPGLPIWVWGSSMGAAATAFALAEESRLFDGAVFDSCYSRLFEANDGWWHTFVGPKFKWVLNPVWIPSRIISGLDARHVDVAKALEQVKGLPVLFMYGDRDLIVPIHQAERNIRALADSKVCWFQGCQHSEARWIQTEKYDEGLFEFLFENALLRKSV